MGLSFFQKCVGNNSLSARNLLLNKVTRTVGGSRVLARGGGGARLKGVLVTNYPQQVTRKLLGPFNIRMFVPGRR